MYSFLLNSLSNALIVACVHWSRSAIWLCVISTVASLHSHCHSWRYNLAAGEVVPGISPVLLLTCILSWHLYSSSDHITNWNTYARLSDVTLLNKLTPLATQQSVIGFVGITGKDFLRIARDRRWSFLIIGKRLGIDPRRLVFSIKNTLPAVWRGISFFKKTHTRARTWK